MSMVKRDYMNYVAAADWMPRDEWVKNDNDPDSDITGSKVSHSGEAGSIWISGPVPTPLDHDNLSVSVKTKLSSGRLGIEWCHAKKGKFHPIVWADESTPDVLCNVPSVPTTAMFRLVVELGDGGEAQLEVRECKGESRAALKAHVNQIGYNVGQPKTFVAEANTAAEGAATFRVISPIRGPGQEFVTVYEGTLEPAGTNDLWGRTYWRGDFSALDEEGNFYIHAVVGEGAEAIQAESPTFAIASGYVPRKTLDAAQRFFWFQRCGMAVPGWHEACHLDDCVVTPEGVTIEAAGAWHDAGDYNKYNGFTPLSAYSLAYAAEDHAELCETRRHNEYDDVLDEALWGAKYLAKMQDPKSGKLWSKHFTGYGYWGLPEKETDNRIGDDDRVAEGEAKNMYFVSVFARLGRMTQNPEYIGRAVSHWNLAYDAEANGAMACAETLIAAMELHVATGDEKYAGIALECARRIVACQGSDDTYDGFYAATPGGAPIYSVVTNGQPAAAVALWARENPEHPFAAKATESVMKYLSYQRALANNPFGLSKCYNGTTEAWFMPFNKDADWHVGDNSHYLSDAWAAFLAYQVTGDVECLRFGLDQFNWIMGANPYGICMVHGLGKVHTATTHHRYNSIPGQPQGSPDGSVFNGIVRFNAKYDIPLWDLLPQGTPRYQCNEPWLPHNAYYLLAVTELATICQEQKD